MPHFDPDQIPDLRTHRDSRARIDTPRAWEMSQRPDILRFFQDEVFGRVPGCPTDLRFTRVRRADSAPDGKAVLETVEASFSGPFGRFAFPFHIFFPKLGGLAALRCSSATAMRTKIWT